MSVRLAARSVILWTLSGLFFFLVSLFSIALSLVVDPRRFEGLIRRACLLILRLAGARWEVRHAPGFDPTRTSFFAPNHVNLFDAFVLFPAIPQHVRGVELESHFKIPVYGWLMKRFGNVPVPVLKNPSDLKKMWRSCQRALDAGTSLTVFPEGTRTKTGRVGPFKDGIFRMAIEFGYPIVPISIVGSFDFNNKLSWLLRPSKIVVHVHDTIETKGLTREDIPALVRRVHAVVSRPVELAPERGQ